MFKKLLFIISGMTICLGAEADDTSRVLGNPARVRYFKIQYAGNMGLFSIGYGKSILKTNVTVDINYGYLPSFINGVSVHTIALKPSFHFNMATIGKTSTGVYTGASVNYSIASKTYMKYPDYFPRNYYNPNAIHVNPFIGARIGFPVNGKKIKVCSLYSELGTVDYQLKLAFTNKLIRMADIVNLCFGVVFVVK